MTDDLQWYFHPGDGDGGGVSGCSGWTGVVAFIEPWSFSPSLRALQTTNFPKQWMLDTQMLVCEKVSVESFPTTGDSKVTLRLSPLIAI